jgi:N-acetyl-anhydromuramyl-L-alanine amidase AmpD
MTGIALREVQSYPADRVRSSPNWRARPADVDAISVLVVHATADGGDEEGAETWMCNPSSKVSAHLHLRRDGTLTRLVVDRRAAYHAGTSDWRLYPSGLHVSNLNRISLGIEVANRNDGREPYTAAQYDRLAAVVHHYCRQGLALENVCGHEHIAPNRKHDPGPAFDWARLRLDVLRLRHPDPAPDIDGAPDDPDFPALHLDPLP